MASGGGELPEGPEELGPYIEDTGKGGSQSRVSGTFFKAVVQAFLIFGAETWVMTPCIGQSLGGFHHRVAQQIRGSQPKWQVDNSWEYLPLNMAIQEAVFEEMGEYVLKR